MTGKPKDDATFVELFERVGPTETAKTLGITVNGVYQRRRGAEQRIGRQITAPAHYNNTRFHISHPGKLDANISDGTILIGSDCHYWPGVVTTAHRAFVKFCKMLKPAIVVMNGDVLDGASISRHPPIGWENRPSIIKEIEACKERLDE